MKKLIITCFILSCRLALGSYSDDSTFYHPVVNYGGDSIQYNRMITNNDYRVLADVIDSNRDDNLDRVKIGLRRLNTQELRALINDINSIMPYLDANDKSKLEYIRSEVISELRNRVDSDIVLVDDN